ncbi:MAG: putative phage-associated protein [Candidatus Deianiraeaceae bacterium]|jgi:uncharacterized phage-associated protein
MNNRELFAVTNYILDNGNGITNLKFQKLLFFFYGIHSCLYNNSQFEINIEAWKLGPVIPATYNEFRDHGSNIITSRANMSMEEDMVDFPKLESKDLMQSAKITLIYYNRFTAGELVNKSHELRCWKEKYDETPKTKMDLQEIRSEFDEKIMQGIMDYFKST